VSRRSILNAIVAGGMFYLAAQCGAAALRPGTADATLIYWLFTSLFAVLGIAALAYAFRSNEPDDDDDGPTPDAPCDRDYCGHGCEASDIPGELGFFFREIETEYGADVMIYCTCEHHGDDYRARVEDHNRY